MKSVYKIIALYFLSSLILFAGTYSGGGTSGDPYQIASLNDLRELCQTSADCGAYFIQTANIDASATHY